MTPAADGAPAGETPAGARAGEKPAGARAGETPAGNASAGGSPPGGVSKVIEDALTEIGVTFESPRPGAYLVKLEGQHKLATMTWLIVGAHSLNVEAFFCRQPDENHARFYRFLLERNGRMYGVHFALDPAGDVYLAGRLPIQAVTPGEIDRLLGCVLSYSDENFDTALEIGFATSIRKEWEWRVKRSESLANLRAFARFADPDVRG
ncbi:MAG: YbjN domain-containing protein [Micromonosporaceae bacterium]